MTFGQNNFTRSMLAPLLTAIPVIVIAPAILQPFALAQLSIFALLALSLGLIWGYGGILCFGQGAFFGIGAYSYVILVTNLSLPWTSLILAICCTMIVAACLGLVMFYGRLGDVYLAIVTLVFTLILNRFMNATASPEYQIGSARLGGFNGIPGFEVLKLPWSDLLFMPDILFFYICFGILIMAWIFCRWLLRTHFGRVMIAIRENERKVEFAGYDTRLHKTISFAIGGGLAGMAGVLYANWAGIVTPNLFSLTQSAEIIIWTIVGGIGTLIGPIIGAILLVFLKLLLGYQSVVDNYFLLGVLLILVVIWFPNGIAGAAAQSRFMSRTAVKKWKTHSNRTMNARRS